MLIPNADKAVIEQDKIALYLLDTEHLRGGSKAKLLISLGYDAKHWQQLAEDLRFQHLQAEFLSKRETAWGSRYDIVAPLTGPNGDTVLFHSVWQIDLGKDRPRLITMYPE